MNGVMHFSVLDGWWVEGYKPGAGWALPMERTYDDQNYQDELDAATIYTIIENDIAPTFYNADNGKGYSASWIEYVKNTVAQVACNFTTNRMLTDYVNQYYDPQSERYEKVVADDYKMARDIAAWKKRMRRDWSQVEVISVTKPDSAAGNVSTDHEYKLGAVLSIGDLDPQEIGVEFIFATQDAKNKFHIISKYECTPVESNDGVVKYETVVLPETTGVYQLAARIFAKNPLLPHRQAFELVRWL